jgi:hypothetical protein
MTPAPQNNTLMLCDCVVLMRGLTAQSVDLALTDPAYINRGERTVTPFRPPPGPAPLWGPMVEAEQPRKGNQMTVTNKDRAEWAAAALRHFQSITGTDWEDCLGDLLCDLMHFANTNNFDFKAAVIRASGHYIEELHEADKKGGAV